MRVYVCVVVVVVIVLHNYMLVCTSGTFDLQTGVLHNYILIDFLWSLVCLLLFLT